MADTSPSISVNAQLPIHTTNSNQNNIEYKVLNAVLNFFGNPKVFYLLLFFLVILIICLGIKSTYLIFFSVEYLASPAVEKFQPTYFDRFIRELDIAGLLGGIVGIAISLYMTSVIQQIDDFKKQSSEKLIADIRGQVIQLSEQSANFLPIDNAKSVIESLNRICETSERERKLYIMCRSANFGDLLGLRLHTILDFAGDISASTLKSKSFVEYNTYYQNFAVNMTQIQNRIHQMKTAHNNPNPMFVTLKADSYKSYIEKIINSNKSTFIFFPKNGDLVNTYQHTTKGKVFDSISEWKDLNNFYFISLEMLQNISGASNEEKLVNVLVQKQQNSIDSLKEEGFDVKEVESIDCDFFLNEMSEPGEESYCLLMFSDQESIANSGKKIVAFQIRKEKYINDSFMEMIKTSS